MVPVLLFAICCGICYGTCYAIYYAICHAEAGTDTPRMVLRLGPTRAPAVVPQSPGAPLPPTRMRYTMPSTDVAYCAMHCLVLTSCTALPATTPDGTMPSVFLQRQGHQ
eukprot:3712251-Rhodomonas_salina.1